MNDKNKILKNISYSEQTAKFGAQTVNLHDIYTFSKNHTDTIFRTCQFNR